MGTDTCTVIHGLRGQRWRQTLTTYGCMAACRSPLARMRTAAYAVRRLVCVCRIAPLQLQSAACGICVYLELGCRSSRPLPRRACTLRVFSWDHTCIRNWRRRPVSSDRRRRGTAAVRRCLPRTRPCHPARSQRTALSTRRICVRTTRRFRTCRCRSVSRSPHATSPLRCSLHAAAKGDIGTFCLRVSDTETNKNNHKECGCLHRFFSVRSFWKFLPSVGYTPNSKFKLLANYRKNSQQTRKASIAALHKWCCVHATAEDGPNEMQNKLSR